MGKIWKRGILVWPVLAWYDLWIGVFIDRSKSRIYVMCFGVGFCVGWGWHMDRAVQRYIHDSLTEAGKEDAQLAARNAAPPPAERGA